VKKGSWDLAIENKHQQAYNNETNDGTAEPFAYDIGNRVIEIIASSEEFVGH
jgi:hypothetical protein